MFKGQSSSALPTLRRTSMVKHKVYYNLILLLITLGFSIPVSAFFFIKAPALIQDNFMLVASLGALLHVLVMIVFFGIEGRSHRRKQHKAYLSVSQYLMALESINSSDIKDYLRANSDQSDLQYVLTKEFYVQRSIESDIDDKKAKTRQEDPDDTDKVSDIDKSLSPS